MWAIARNRVNMELIKKIRQQKFIKDISAFYAYYNHSCMHYDEHSKKMVWCEKNKCVNTTKINESTSLRESQNNQVIQINKTDQVDNRSKQNFTDLFNIFLKNNGHYCMEYSNGSLKWCQKCLCTGKNAIIEKHWIDEYFCCCSYIS
jgi:hypothetical protein